MHPTPGVRACVCHINNFCTELYVNTKQLDKQNNSRRNCQEDKTVKNTIHYSVNTNTHDVYLTWIHTIIHHTHMMFTLSRSNRTAWHRVYTHEPRSRFIAGSIRFGLLPSMSPSVNSSPSSVRVGYMVSMNPAPSILSASRAGRHVSLSLYSVIRIEFQTLSFSLETVPLSVESSPNTGGHLAFQRWRQSQTMTLPSDWLVLVNGSRKIRRCRPIRSLAGPWSDDTSMSRGAGIICIDTSI